MHSLSVTEDVLYSVCDYKTVRIRDGGNRLSTHALQHPTNAINHIMMYQTLQTAERYTSILLMNDSTPIDVIGKLQLAQEPRLFWNTLKLV